jgi:hypothetical protein
MTGNSPALQRRVVSPVPGRVPQGRLNGAPSSRPFGTAWILQQTEWCRVRPGRGLFIMRPDTEIDPDYFVRKLWTELNLGWLGGIKARILFPT